MEFSSLKEQIPLRTRRPTLLDVALDFPLYAAAFR
jgi:hypothetical protein